MVLAIDESKLPEEAVLEDAVIERQLSYFSDWNSFRGLVDYFGSDDPRGHYFTLIAKKFNKDNPRSPVSIWPMLEPDFKDLIVRMTKVDPRQRLIAEQALAHTWFREIPV